MAVFLRPCRQQAAGPPTGTGKGQNLSQVEVRSHLSGLEKGAACDASKVPACHSLAERTLTGLGRGSKHLTLAFVAFCRKPVRASHGLYYARSRNLVCKQPLLQKPAAGAGARAAGPGAGAGGIGQPDKRSNLSPNREALRSRAGESA